LKDVLILLLLVIAIGVSVDILFVVVGNCNDVIVILILNAVSLPIEHFRISDVSCKKGARISVSLPYYWLKKLAFLFEFIFPSIFPILFSSIFLLFVCHSFRIL
jgi:hypothetical protein